MSAIRNSMIALAALAASGLYASDASAGTNSLVAFLYGGNEVDGDGNANTGDPNGYGSATVNFVNRRKLCFTLFYNDIELPQAAHIHFGPPGLNGPVVITLSPAATFGTNKLAAGCVKADRKVIAMIRKNPDAYYVNVHNQDYPGGALRGQLF